MVDGTHLNSNLSDHLINKVRNLCQMFNYCHNMLLAQQYLPVICEICNTVVSSLFSSETMCQLSERAQPQCQCLPFQTSEIGDWRHSRLYKRKTSLVFNLTAGSIFVHFNVLVR